MESHSQSSSGTLAHIESFVMGIFSKIPSRRVHLWFSAYFRPEETYQKEKGNASWPGLLSGLFLVALLHAAVSTAFTPLVIQALYSLTPSNATREIPAIVPINFFSYSLVIGVISPLLTFFLAFIFSKLLGGKGKFMQQSYCMALIYCAYGLFSAVFFILAVIPCLNIVGLLPTLYGVYGQYRVLKTASGLSAMKAAISLLLGSIISWAVMGAALLLFVKDVIYA